MTIPQMWLPLEYFTHPSRQNEDVHRLYFIANFDKKRIYKR